MDAKQASSQVASGIQRRPYRLPTEVNRLSNQVLVMISGSSRDGQVPRRDRCSFVPTWRFDGVE